jgi:hypothetical protein
MNLREKTAGTLLLILAVCTVASGQNPVEIQFGVRAGIPFTAGLESSLTGVAQTFGSEIFERSSFSLGPTFAVILTNRIGIEFDSLYKPVNFTESFEGPNQSRSVTRGSSWEFPLLVNYRALRGVTPYGGGGILLGATLSGTTETRTVNTQTGVETVGSGKFRTSFKQLPAYVVNGGWNGRLLVWWCVQSYGTRTGQRFLNRSGLHDRNASSNF